MPYQRKHRPFTSLSRRSRRRKVIQLKNRIHQERHRCGGVFYDECDFSRYGEGSAYVWEWSDIFFVGLAPDVFWNAEIITAELALRDAIESRTFEKASSLLNEQERQQEFRMETRPNFNAKGKIVSHTLIRQQEQEYSIFDGLTFSQYVQKCEGEMTRDVPIICRGYQYLPGYVYGRGLRIIVDAPSLSLQVIEAAIADFRARGEVEWCSAEPVVFKP
ncbi:hypothetical protein [Pantoea sp. At-9b]|uniref:hypothetical protein n=1 Tax=Pantoea sp. (strain At-9b) TaxID=592316 RepID=UPI0001B40216|nr:hypothetical protein [Pantoea sp. At-9b]ADU72668.1 hypothetical protein Pat9b_4699 [Pantoea sp. At-9b]